MADFNIYELSDGSPWEVPYNTFENVQYTKSSPVRKLDANEKKYENFLDLMYRFKDEQNLGNTNHSVDETTESEQDSDDNELTFETIADLNKSQIEESNNSGFKSSDESLKNMDFADLLTLTGLDKYINITSRIRSEEHNRRIGGSKNSWHLESRARSAGHMGAIDITPKRGYTFSYIFNKLTQNPTFQAWAKLNRYNISDETDRPGYGAHLHLGPDYFGYNSKKYMKQYT